MEYVTHLRPDGTYQSLREHEEQVAALAGSFAGEYGAEEHARRTGLQHENGKNSTNGQRRQRDPEHTAKVDHATAGTQLAFRMKDPFAAFAVAGHHGGLPDGGEKSNDGSGTLWARINKRLTGGDEPSAWKTEIHIPEKVHFPEWIFSEKDSRGRTMYTRMLFSCLVDADFLDTETAIQGKQARGGGETLDCLLKKIRTHTAPWLQAPVNELCAKRNAVLARCMRGGEDEKGLYTLTVPTGGGKTLSSMAFALSHAVRHGMKRIIYVIPYTSIIEQTADTFAPLCGEHTPILQHHSNFCFDSEGIPDKTSQKLKLSTENWDAPLIITTSVQFFQSLFHYKSSGLRKLHNIADSVIILDEVHLLPVDMLQPCLRGIGYLTRYLNCECVFLSATMPDYKPLFRQYLNGQQGVDLITQKDDFSFFQKCRYTNLGEQDPEHVAELAAKHRSSLIIVNSRRTARQMYQLLSGKKYHLSTYMTPHDRSETIRKIRSALEQDEPVSVVSTSLVEAGVDLDFEAVFRQLAGLDNILQSGGRCNREGKRPMGDVYIFRTQDKPQRDIRIRASIVQDLLDHGADLSTGACVEEYYRRLFDFNAQLIQENSIARNAVGFDSIPFRSYAQANQFIKNYTHCFHYVL